MKQVFLYHIVSMVQVMSSKVEMWFLNKLHPEQPGSVNTGLRIVGVTLASIHALTPSWDLVRKQY